MAYIWTLTRWMFLILHIVAASSQHTCDRTTIKRYCVCEDDPQYDKGTAVTCHGINLTLLDAVVLDLQEDVTSLSVDQSNLGVLRKSVFETNNRTSLLRTLQITKSVERIEEGAFMGLGNLYKLVISQNPSLKHLKKVLDGIPNVREIHITNNSIETIAGDAFFGVELVTILSIAGNKLSTLGQGTFQGLGTLKELYLNGNAIKTIQKGTFGGLGALSKLNLNGNLGVQLADDIFRDVPGLTELTLDQLTADVSSVFPSNLLRGLTKLSKLELQNNSLAGFPIKVLKPVASTLTTLKLSQNKIGVLETDFFNVLTNLQFLDLSQNSINDIPKGTFNILQMLRNLKLGYNNISRIENGTFSELSNLVSLVLSNNNLSICGESAFTGLPNLKYLYLNKNKLTWLQPRVFRSLPKLLVLNLDGNDFGTLSPEMFVDLLRKTGSSPSVSVEVTYNPIECNCSMRLLKDWMFENEAAIHLKIECATPSKFRKKFVDEIRNEEYGCTKPVIKGCCETTINLVLNQTVKFECIATGQPKPEISFHVISGNPLPKNRTTYSQDGSVVTISRVTEDTPGVFCCEAKSIMGTSTSYYKLMIKNGTIRSTIWIGVGVGCFIVLIVLVAGLTYIFKAKSCTLPFRKNETVLVESGHYYNF